MYLVNIVINGASVYIYLYILHVFLYKCTNIMHTNERKTRSGCCIKRPTIAFLLEVYRPFKKSSRMRIRPLI